MFHLTFKRITLTTTQFPAAHIHIYMNTLLQKQNYIKIYKYQLSLVKDNYNSRFLPVSNELKSRMLCTNLSFVENSSNKVLALLESDKFINENKFNVKLFLEELFNEEKLTISEWDVLKQKLLQYKKCNEMNFSGMMMNRISSKRNQFLADSFLEYLRAKNQEPNISVLSSYLHVCQFNVKLCGENTILNIYKDIMHKIKILDSTTKSAIIHALCATSHWIIAYNIMKEETVNLFDCENLSAVVSAAFRHNRTDIALELTQQITNLNGSVTDDLYAAWLEAVLNSSEKSQLLEKFFFFLRSTENLVPHSCVNNLIECFKRLENENWLSKLVNVNRKGICPNCNQQLELAEITLDQFKELKEAVLSRIMKGTDVYIKTTPEELNRFLEFVRKTAPYDIVIDGLNVAYHQSYQNNKGLAEQLNIVVKHFSKKKNMKILVLGRKHMKKWNKVHMNSVQENAHIFFTDNISHDDPFMIYAAMYSGPNTLVLTKDLLRNHKFTLQEPSLAKYFECWRNTHQIFLDFVNKEKQIVKYQEPRRHCIVAQGNIENSWHIPYNDGKLLGPFDIHQNWLCIRKVK